MKPKLSRWLVLSLIIAFALPAMVSGQDIARQPTDLELNKQDLSDITTTLQPVPPLPHDTMWLRSQPWLQPQIGATYPSRYAQPSAAKPATGIDLDVTYIERTPRYYAYKVSYLRNQSSCPYPYPEDRGPYLCPDNAGLQRWPAPGETVQFIAHVINKGSVASPVFAYRWQIDGATMLNGSGPALAPGAEFTTSLSWTWSHSLNGERLLGSHTVALQVDPANIIAEDFETNNLVIDPTEAAGLRFVIHPDSYSTLNAGCEPGLPRSAEDWIQEHLTLLNDRMANSVYPGLAPQGGLQRVRLDKVVIANEPSPADLGYDGNWWIDAGYSCDPGNPSWRDWGLVHELAHQLGAVDLYNYDTDYYHFYELEDRFGQPVVLRWNWPRPGIMGGGDIGANTPPAFSDHTVAGLNSSLGYRRGYYGEYKLDLPQLIRLQVVDSAGNPASGVSLELYQRQDGDWIGGSPDITGLTDAAGVFVLPNRTVHGGVTTATGHVLHDNPFGPVDVVGQRNTFLVHLRREEHEEYFWLRVTDFNLAYWRGHTGTYTHVVESHVPSPLASAAPADLKAMRVQYGTVDLGWDAVRDPSTAGYHVYRAQSPTYFYTRVLTGTTNTQATFPTEYSEAVFAVTAVDTMGRESGFSRFAYVPTFHDWIMDLAPMRQNERVVFDAATEKHLVRQRSDGRYLQRVGTPHHHWNDARGLASDSCGKHLVLAQVTTDQPNTIQIYDRRAELIYQFGGTGVDPGRFQSPYGVDVVGCLDTPYEDPSPARLDTQTTFLARFDGTLLDERGHMGQSTGPIAFQAGRHGQAVAVPLGATLAYLDAGLLQPADGTIEFWVQPSIDSPSIRVYLSAGNAPWQSMIRIDQVGSYLRVLVWKDNTETGVSTTVNWQPGEWHHIAVTWHGTILRLYTDGILGGESTLPLGMPVTLWPLWIGTNYVGGDPAAAAFDDLRLSTVARVGNLADARIFVADTGNHRVQALDGLGQPLATFGSHGSGTGQFDSPWDVAADEQGRVAVSDSGNHRVQWLTFNGTAFSFVRAVGGLSEPRGLDLDGYGQVYVADAAANRLVVFGATGEQLAVHTTPAPPYSGPFLEPSSVVVDANRRLVVADKGNRRVVEVNDSATCLRADQNYDRQVTVLDITAVADVWPAAATSGAYRSALDMNDNGIIDVIDVQVVARHFGAVCP